MENDEQLDAPGPRRNSRRVPGRFLAVLIVSLLCTQCAWFRKEPVPEAPKPSFRVDPERYAALKKPDARIRIDLTAQKARLLDADGGTVIETDISTGKPGHETPAGRFKVQEMIADKRSNRYGRYLDAKSGADLGKSWEHPKPPKDSRYEGFSMPYWMRLTWDGVGIHVGYVVPRTACSFGCIRVPEGVQPLLFEKCRVGTPVEIVGVSGH